MISVVMIIMFLRRLKVLVSNLAIGIITLKLIIVIINIYNISLRGRLSLIGAAAVLKVIE